MRINIARNVSFSKLTGLFVAAVLSASSAAAADKPIDFNKQIRPILSNNCFRCHGPDSKERAADLRLDERESAVAEHDSGLTIVPGKPGDSVFVERITSDDPDERMPPADSGSKLTPAEVKLLTQWIKQGAPYAKHWSYVKPVRSPVPAIRNKAWPRNDIDRFLLARLESEGLSPSPEANRRALIRRLSLDLTGLPPTPAEIEQFVNDKDPRAYEKLVDRLLAKSAYGEHWARMWLDLARYADSAGYADDPPRTIWAFRDYVIQSLNANKPFDQFTIEQLAGDMLPNATQEQRVATAFHRNTLTNSEGGTDDEEFRNEAVVDRVNTTLAVWMGTTMACAQCHDHKYDPISQEDYFRFFAILNNTADSDKKNERPTIKVATGENSQKRKGIEAEIAKVEAEIAGAAKKNDGKSPAATAGPLKSRFVRIELPGNGKFLSLAEVQVFVGNENVAGKGTASQINTAYNGPAKLAIDGNTNGDYHAAKTTTHTAASNNPWWEVKLAADTTIDRIAVWNRTDGAGDRLANVRVVLLDAQRTPLWITTINTAPSPSATVQPPSDSSKLSKADRDALATYNVTPTANSPAHKRLAALKKQLAAVQTTTTVPVMQELAKPRKTHIQLRGSFLNKDKEVTAGVPKEFDNLPKGTTPNRLTMAKWLVNGENPLTARVIVNRYWEAIFGIGIVSTSEEFGSQGDLPSNQELLDYLAVEFVENKWDLKQLLRQLVTSAAYRQSSRVTPALQEHDPDNRLLARGPRFRMSAEMIRDQALAVSGLLSSKMYGPPVKPPQPNLGLKAAFGGGTDWKTSTGEDRYRRAIYTTWRRSNPYPSMLTFDAPNREVCTIRRARTNTPLQALVMLNDPVYIEAAQELARRFIASGKTTADRAQAMFRACVARDPSEAELARLVILYDKAYTQFKADTKSANDLATKPRGPAPKGADIAALAAWTVVGNVVLNLDEMLMKR